MEFFRSGLSQSGAIDPFQHFAAGVGLLDSGWLSPAQDDLAKIADGNIDGGEEVELRFVLPGVALFNLLPERNHYTHATPNAPESREPMSEDVARVVNFFPVWDARPVAGCGGDSTLG